MLFSMTKDEMLKLVNQQLESYNKGDLQGFCNCYHPDVAVSFLISNKPGSVGIEIFKERYHSLFSSSPNLKCEIKSRIVLENSIIDEELVTGAKLFPEGLHTTAIYGFRDGLIDRVWFAR